MSVKQYDQWFTKPEVVELIMSSLNASGFDLSRFNEVLDPCVGDKAFGAYITSMMDIDPKYDDIVKQDFLEYTVDHSVDRLILTNFPYGRSASLTVKMINHASTLCDDIVTIGPMTMTRYSRQRRVNPELKLLWEMKLPEHSFLVDGKSKDVPSVVQYWSRTGRCMRVDKPINTHPDFNISSRYNPRATFVIRGVRPVVSNEVDIYDRISPNTRYYSVEPLVNGVEDRFRSIDLVAQCSNTGMPSLSIPECISAYSCLRVDKPVEYKIDDWEFNTNDWNCFVNVNSRKIYEPGHSCFSNSSLRIKSHIPVDELSKKFDEILWVGSSSVSGGVYCLTRADINNQYYEYHRS